MSRTESAYRHTQFGTITVLVLTLGAGLLVRQGVVHAWDPVLAGVLALLCLCLVLFHSLTVRVDAAHIHVFFGPGLIKRRYALANVQTVSRVRSKWWHGWGIRWIPGGVLYAVSGLDAVELNMSNGRVVRIGTDDPEALLAAIRAHCNRESPPASADFIAQ